MHTILCTCADSLQGETVALLCAYQMFCQLDTARHFMYLMHSEYWN